MAQMTCERCGEQIPGKPRKDARFCSGRCRVANHRDENRAAKRMNGIPLPPALTRLPRWVRHSAAKVPITTKGKAASSTDESTWSSYQEASESTAGSGLGFVLSGDGILCVDLDHCISDGRLSEAAEAFLSTLPPTYIEISPSGIGLHIWGRGLVLTVRKIRNGPLHGEVIASKKYATVTGRRFRSAPLTLANIAKQASSLIY